MASETLDEFDEVNARIDELEQAGGASSELARLRARRDVLERELERLDATVPRELQAELERLRAKLGLGGSTRGG